MKSIPLVVLILSMVCFDYGSSQRRFYGPMTLPKSVMEEKKRKLEEFKELMDEAKEKGGNISPTLND